MRIIEDAEIEKEIIEAWQNGFQDDSLGTVDYGPGHFIYYWFADKGYYAVQTDSLGFTYLIEFESNADMEQHKASYLAEYPIDDDECDCGCNDF